MELWLKDKISIRKTLVALDDPMYSDFEDMHEKGIINMVSVKSTGCEMFAKMAMEFASDMIHDLYRVVGAGLRACLSVNMVLTKCYLPKGIVKAGKKIMSK